jgi:hypothetical protein
MTADMQSGVTTGDRSTEQVAKCREVCRQLQERIERRRRNRQSISYEQHKLIRERVKQIKAEIKLERRGIA